MNTTSPLDSAIAKLGLTRVARECRVSHQAVRKWQRQGRMPRTEWTGETRYSELIEAASAGEITKAMLLAKWPQNAASADATHAESFGCDQLVRERVTQ